MSGSTLKTAQAAINLRGVPLELVRGEGYHYFIYDRPDIDVYETESVMVPYTNSQSDNRWVECALSAMETIRAVLQRRGIEI
jgi:hypothetical protein